MNPESITTAYGTVPTERMIHQFEAYQRRLKKRQEKRLEFIQTEEGKQWNRSRSKDYYEKHKEEILQKRKEAYSKKKNEKVEKEAEK